MFIWLVATDGGGATGGGLMLYEPPAGLPVFAKDPLGG